MARSGETRRYFTCGFGPGHHVHPVRTLEAAVEDPEVVRVGPTDGAMVCLLDRDANWTWWWHHDSRVLSSAARDSAGLAFLHGDSLLRIGGRLLSVSRTPSPCWNDGAHADPNHPAWAGPPVIEPEPTGKLSKDCSDHPGPGHELPFWRLDAALAKGPGTPVDHVELGYGLVTLDVGGARLRRLHHNTLRIQGALTEATEGIPFEWPPDGPPGATVTPIEERGTSDFGDAPPVALLDEEVLRVGDCYFWLGDYETCEVRGCWYLRDQRQQFERKRIMGMWHRYRQGTAQGEHVWLPQIAAAKSDLIEVRVHVPQPSLEPSTGFLLPVDGPLETEADRDALVDRMFEAFTSLVPTIPTSSGAGGLLYPMRRSRVGY